MPKRYLVLLVTGLLLGCATPSLDTASGHPEVMMNARPEAIVSAILVRLAADGWSIESQTTTGLVASKEMDGSQAVLTQLAIGNGYSTTPRAELRFVIVPTRLGDPVRVFAQASASTQMAFGQVNRMDTTKGWGQDLQKILVAVKTDAEANRGTR